MARELPGPGVLVPFCRAVGGILQHLDVFVLGMGKAEVELIQR